MFILFIRLLSSVHTGSVQGEARVFSLVIVEKNRESLNEVVVSDFFSEGFRKLSEVLGES